MDELDTTIPSSMRPSKSVVDLVKTTLNDLICSATNTMQSQCCDDVENNESDSLSEVETDKDDTSVVAIITQATSSLRTKEAFKKRVKSFTLSLWCGKPLCLSPPLLAQYGWECVGEDLIKCCTCAAILPMHLPWPNASNYHVTCEEFRKKMVTGHMKICAWPSNPASDYILNPFNITFFSSDERENLKSQFIARAKRLCKLNKDLPLIKPDILEEMGVDASALSLFFQLCNFDEQRSLDILEKEVKVSAMTLSLCGWDTNLDQQLSSIFSEETGRSIGLWNFISVATKDEALNFSAAKKRKVESAQKSLALEKDWFHPLKQHHVWSPWIVVLSANFLKSNDSEFSSVTRDDVDPGWLVLRELLLASKSAEETGGILDDCENNQPSNKSSFASKQQKSVKTPPRAMLQRAKRMLNEWSAASSMLEVDL